MMGQVIHIFISEYATQVMARIYNFEPSWNKQDAKNIKSDWTRYMFTIANNVGAVDVAAVVCKHLTQVTIESRVQIAKWCSKIALYSANDYVDVECLEWLHCCSIHCFRHHYHRFVLCIIGHFYLSSRPHLDIRSINYYPNNCGQFNDWKKKEKKKKYSAWRSISCGYLKDAT